MTNIIKDIKDLFKLERISEATRIPVATLMAYSRGARKPRGEHLSQISKYFISAAYKILTMLAGE